MWKAPAKFVLALLILLFFLQIKAVPNVSAQAPTYPPVNNTASWGPDPDVIVTEVGKNADRARQLIWWVFSHPGVHAAPVIASLWGFSRNVVYIFVVLVIVAFGISLILSKRSGSMGPIFSGLSSPVFGMNVPSVFLKVGAILLYVTFSYVLIVGLIQTSDIIMRFFIENVGGKDLFNVIFAGAGNTEENYITFVGYRDNNLLNQEMVNTSIFMVKMTSMTYYVMSLIMILRTIILWFLLIISPFLALLMPFVFIRNIGWIWIGVFFQWLFYGPLFALFLASLTRIWVSGIPYSFDFSRVNKPQGQVYKTAINILYGGPAQTLSPGNSANYIDTFAEYVIALVMLWTAILLPWLLLRIFRDYCCAMIAASQSTLNSIFDRIRQYPTPPPAQPIAPSTSTGMAAELPFRQRVEERIRDIQYTHIEDIKDISKTTSVDIARAMDISVSRLSDVSHYEMNQDRRSEIQKNLEKIGAPERITSSTEREKFMNLRQELQTRAEKGDRLAQSMLIASESKTDKMVEKASTVMAGRSTVAGVGQIRTTFAPSVTVGVPASKTAVISTPASVSSTNQVIQTVSKEVGMNEKTVREVLHAASVGVPTSAGAPQTVTAGVPVASSDKIAVAQVAARTGVSDQKVKQILETAQTVRKVAVTTSPTVSLEDYEEVKQMWLKHYRNAPIPVSENIKDRNQWLTEEEKKLTNITNLLSSNSPELKQQGLEKVAEILPFMLLGGFSDNEILTYIKAKLEAERQIKGEFEIEEKAKMEVKGVREEEETLVEAGKKKEEKKEAVLSEEAAMEIETGGNKKSADEKDKKPQT